MKLAIVIPAYNEESAISAVLQTLPKTLRGVDEIVSIVVDDGSNDDTAKIAKKNGSRLVQFPINMGVGTATVAGLKMAMKVGCGVALTMDADGQHSPKDIPRLIKPILDKKADVVIGTRLIDRQKMPFYKSIGNWMMNVFTYAVFRKWSFDSQSGMRAYSKKALEKMDLHAIGYEICSEILGEVKRLNLRLAEVPIQVIYSDYSKVKGQDWVNGINILTKIIAIKLSRKK